MAAERTARRPEQQDELRRSQRRWSFRDGHPTGTVTLVFTDIEGSTVLWEHLGPDCRC